MESGGIIINYKHLRYFWMVAKEGSVTQAAERLQITPQTISGQISILERELGKPLFTRVGRNLELTESGRLAMRYAEDIFSMGSELEEMIRQPLENRALMFKVGVVDVVPKSIAYRMLAPALQIPESVRIHCREGSMETLLIELSLHRIDLVISEAPMPPGGSVRGANHRLGDCGISFFAHPQLAQQLGPGFPHNLNGQPMLLSGRTAAVNSQLSQWFERHRIFPLIVGEFDDSALMKAFGQAGTGVFIAPTPIEKEVQSQYGVVVVGRTESVREQFYAISIERRISHPAVTVVTDTAREWLV
ncbi:MAG: transcriptional activator NhaR [Halopseudomonas sp.]